MARRLIGGLLPMDGGLGLMDLSRSAMVGRWVSLGLGGAWLLIAGTVPPLPKLFPPTGGSGLSLFPRVNTDGAAAPIPDTTDPLRRMR